MIKNISFKNLFFKQDHTGKRQPTILAWVCMCAIVFGSFFLSKNTGKVSKKEHKQDLIKEKEIFAASNAPIRKDENNGLDISQVLEIAKNEEINKAKRINGKVDAKMIVYDQTNDYQSDHIVPLGSMINCVLIHNIVTNNFSSPVIVQVWKDFYFDGKLLLPFGTRIYGTARAGKERDRVLVAFQNVVFQDGREIKISAIGLSQDGSGGLTGEIVNKSTKKKILAMALNFLSGMALGLQEKATNAITGLAEFTNSSRNAVLQGVANTFENESRTIQKDIDSADGYAIVLAGNPLIVYIEKSTDVKPF